MKIFTKDIKNFVQALTHAQMGTRDLGLIKDRLVFLKPSKTSLDFYYPGALEMGVFISIPLLEVNNELESALDLYKVFPDKFAGILMLPANMTETIEIRFDKQSIYMGNENASVALECYNGKILVEFPTKEGSVDIPFKKGQTLEIPQLIQNKTLSMYTPSPFVTIGKGFLYSLSEINLFFTEKSKLGELDLEPFLLEDGKNKCVSNHLFHLLANGLVSSISLSGNKAFLHVQVS